MPRASPERWQMVGGTWSLSPWWGTDSALTACKEYKLLKCIFTWRHNVYGVRLFCKDPALLVPGSMAELDSFHKAFLADWFILPLSLPMEEYTLKSTEDMSPLDKVCLDGCGSTREANRYPPDPNSLFLLTFRPCTQWHCGLIPTFLIYHFHFYFCPR